MSASGAAVRGKTQELVEALGAGVVSGRLAQGSVLSWDRLEAEYGVSRTPLREAVAVLKGKGLLTVVPQNSTTVSLHQHWNLLDPDVMRWAPEGGWLRRDALEFADEVALLAAAKPSNAVLAYAARTLRSEVPR